MLMLSERQQWGIEARIAHVRVVCEIGASESLAWLELAKRTWQRCMYPIGHKTLQLTTDAVNVGRV